MSTFAFNKVSAQYPGAVIRQYNDRPGDPWLEVKAERIVEVVTLLKHDPELDLKLFLSIDAVDRLQLPDSTPRFELVYFLYSLHRGEHARIKCRVSEDSAHLPTITSVYQGANWFERLVWDFYGIRFDGHPDLRRILLYEEFKGHPLRKDYALRDRQPLIPERPLKDIYRGPGTNGVTH